MQSLNNELLDDFSGDKQELYEEELDAVLMIIEELLPITSPDGIASEELLTQRKNLFEEQKARFIANRD